MPRRLAAVEAGVDVDAIAAAVRERVPSAIAAVLVGSAVASRGGCVSDIDVTALATDVPPGEDRGIEFEACGWPIHVVSYEPMHFRAAAAHDETLLLFVREIRKLFRGVILFDTAAGWMERTIDELRTARMPLHLLQRLRDAVAAMHIDAAAPRLAALSAVESLAFAWMHLELSYSYTKPKWLLADAASVEAEHLVPLLEALADELVETGTIETLVAEAAALDPGAGRAAHFFILNRKDAATLVRAGRLREAVFPLRMAAYMLAESRTGEAYGGIASIAAVLPSIAAADPAAASFIRRTLLLHANLRPSLKLAWEAARAEFLDAWERASTARSADLTLSLP